MKKLRFRIRYYLLLLALASLTVMLPGRLNSLAPLQAATEKVTSPAAPVIVVLGDSISAEYGMARGKGWVALLQARLQSLGFNHRVVNASISGETTAGGRSRVKRLVNKHKPSVLIMELGGNDALRGLDLNSTQANLAHIGGISRKAGAQVVVLGMQVPPNYGQAYTTRFATLFKEVAAKHNAALVPFFLSKIADRKENFQPDGIHPRAAVQERLLDTMWPALKPLLGNTTQPGQEKAKQN